MRAEFMGFLRLHRHALCVQRPVNPRNSRVDSLPVPAAQSKWIDVIGAWQIKSWEQYRAVPRLGRKTRFGEQQRAAL
ncbi:MAG: hypothetical protein LAT64_00990 [Phycisphaerales bacterium]|nr:hypothetical protein [Planctomycetota bacterium]MCH8507337.1 hypothetical protein [Phycisphaerales bacterium]